MLEFGQTVTVWCYSDQLAYLNNVLKQKWFLLVSLQPDNARLIVKKYNHMVMELKWKVRLICSLFFRLVIFRLSYLLLHSTCLVRSAVPKFQDIGKFWKEFLESKVEICSYYGIQKHWHMFRIMMLWICMNKILSKKIKPLISKSGIYVNL